MVRKFLSMVATLGMLLALSGAVDIFTPQQVQKIAGVFFVVLIGVQVWPLLATMRNSYGHRRHPVNRLYIVLATVGLIGTLLLMFVFYLHSTIWLITLAGALMITGIVGAGILALFAAPWDDWSTRRGRDFDDEFFGWEEEPVEDVWDTSFRT